MMKLSKSKLYRVSSSSNSKTFVSKMAQTSSDTTTVHLSGGKKLLIEPNANGIGWYLRDFSSLRELIYTKQEGDNPSDIYQTVYSTSSSIEYHFKHTRSGCRVYRYGTSNTSMGYPVVEFNAKMRNNYHANVVAEDPVSDSELSFLFFHFLRLKPSSGSSHGSPNAIFPLITTSALLSTAAVCV